MKTIASGVLMAGEAGTARACHTFPSVVELASGKLIVTARHGSGKDGDDDAITVRAGHGDGKGWVAHPGLPASPDLNGRKGTLKLAYLTALRPGVIIAAAMWVDRTSFPGQPLFNAETEGCLTMAILLSRSDDDGLSWSDWWHVALPEDIGPPSLTAPLVLLADGRLAMSIETNKTYLDAGTWDQKAVLLFSDDEGQSWSAPVVSAHDPSNRIFNWDLRIAAAPDGRLVSFAWTFDREAGEYRNIHRRVSADAGRSWTAPEDIGFADQAARPAILADGRVVLAYVDRFGTRSIRARLADSVEAPFRAESEVVLYTQEQAASAENGASLGEALADMEMWSFGLPSAAALRNGQVLVVYYGGKSGCMDIGWALIAP